MEAPWPSVSGSFRFLRFRSSILRVTSGSHVAAGATTLVSTFLTTTERRKAGRCQRQLALSSLCRAFPETPPKCPVFPHGQSALSWAYLAAKEAGHGRRFSWAHCGLRSCQDSSTRKEEETEYKAGCLCYSAALVLMSPPGARPLARDDTDGKKASTWREVCQLQRPHALPPRANGNLPEEEGR